MIVFAGPQFSNVKVALVDEFKPLDSEHSISRFWSPPGTNAGSEIVGNAIAMKTETAAAKPMSPMVTTFRVLGCNESSDDQGSS